MGTAGHAQQSNLMGGFRGVPAFVVRHLPPSGTCLTSLTLLAIAKSYSVLPLSRTVRGKRRAVGLQAGQGGVGGSQRALLQLQHLPRTSHILTCASRIPTHPLPPGKGAEHGNALLFGQRQTGKEEKALERRTGEADSRSPRWRHSLPFPAKSPGELCKPFLALELWATGQMDTSSAAGRAPNALLGRFCRAGLVPPWGRREGGGTFLASAWQG